MTTDHYTDHFNNIQTTDDTSSVESEPEHHNDPIIPAAADVGASLEALPLAIGGPRVTVRHNGVYYDSDDEEEEDGGYDPDYVRLEALETEAKTLAAYRVNKEDPTMARMASGFALVLMANEDAYPEASSLSSAVKQHDQRAPANVGSTSLDIRRIMEQEKYKDAVDLASFYVAHIPRQANGTVSAIRSLQIALMQSLTTAIESEVLKASMEVKKNDAIKMLEAAVTVMKEAKKQVAKVTNERDALRSKVTGLEGEVENYRRIEDIRKTQGEFVLKTTT